MQKLRICFAGTPAFAAAHLSALLDSAHDVIAVYTQPDRPSGRGKKLQAGPVKNIAIEHAIPVYQPPSLKSAEQTELLSRLAPDLLVVVAYGLILPKAILDIPKYGCINVHASLLPRWRGAAPIERALLAGDEQTGVTIMQMDEGLDTGAMLDKELVAIAAQDNRLDLEEKLCRAGQTALLRTLNDIERVRNEAVEQDDDYTCYAAKLDKAEALIDWTLTAEQISRQIRAGIGRTPAFSFFDKHRLRILVAEVIADTQSAPPGTVVSSSKDSFTVACGQSSLRIKSLQLPGKKVMTVRDIKNSQPSLFDTGKCFSASDDSQP